ncbi:hypothetical protein BC940DRAFT_287221 [Gongronella butleri]|nr:hypothetical protein BC940DRAFT_287221 [Gongronella butleri]
MISRFISKATRVGSQASRQRSMVMCPMVMGARHQRETVQQAMMYTTRPTEEQDKHGHDHFHALYNNENASVLEHLDSPAHNHQHAHTETPTDKDAFSPTVNSLFDE